MKKIIITFVILIAAGGWFVWEHPYQSKSVTKPSKHCTNTEEPCYKISMANQPDMQINSWKHYGNSDCIIFNSLPDNDIHGYCGDYKITKLDR